MKCSKVGCDQFMKGCKCKREGFVLIVEVIGSYWEIFQQVNDSVL